MTEKKEPEKNITEKKSTDVAIASAFEEDAGGGLENMTADDFTIPRLKILQALSPEVNKRDGKYIEGAASGDITNTVTKELYTEENPCIVLPVAYKRLFLEWGPRETGGGLVKQHTDASILNETTKDSSYADVLPNGNYIQTSATHYVLVLEGDSFQQAMIPMAGTQLFTPPSYSHKYKLTTVPESNDRGQWFGWNIETVGAITESEMHLYEAAKFFANTVTADAPVVKETNTDEAPF